MVVLVDKLGRSLKFPHRLDNHNNHPNHDSEEEALNASLQAFRSKVSGILAQILLESKPGGSDFLTLSWVHRCLEKLPMIDKAFAKLAVDIDYPMTKWKESAAEAYLKHTLNVLELLNKISSSVSHLGRARLSLSHGLNLAPNSPSSAATHLRRIDPKDPGNDGFRVEALGAAEAKSGSSKESVIREALAVMIGTGLRLYGVMISGLCGDAKPYFEVRKSAGELRDSSLQSLESLLDEEIKQKRRILKEVKEVNDAAAELVAEIAHRNGGAAAAETLGRKLEILEEVLEGIGKQTDRVFSEVLAARSKFLDTIRHK